MPGSSEELSGTRKISKNYFTNTPKYVILKATDSGVI